MAEADVKMVEKAEIVVPVSASTVATLVTKHSVLNSSFPVLVPYARELALSEKDFVNYLLSVPSPKAPSAEVKRAAAKETTFVAPKALLLEALLSSDSRNHNAASLAAENKTLTTNSDVAFLSTKSALVDLFFELTDSLDGKRLESHLNAAWERNPLATLKVIFNARSIHLGKSSRVTAYRAFGWLYKNHPRTLLTNLVWLTRPVIEKKMAEEPAKGDEAKKEDGPRQTDVDDDEDMVMISSEEDSELDVTRFDVKNGTAHGYWKDLLNILSLAANDGFDTPKETLTTPRPIDKVTKRTRDWSHENARKRKRAKRESNHDRLLLKFEIDPVYRALHLTVARLFANQLKRDQRMLEAGKSRRLSYAAKWAPSAQEAHDRETFIVSTIAEALSNDAAPTGTAERTEYLKRAREDYRMKYTSPLRKALAVVERDISAGSFDNIKYDRVPSLAMNQYQKLFMKKDSDRFLEYVDKVASGKAKISGAVLLPANLVAKVRNDPNHLPRRSGRFPQQHSSGPAMDQLAEARIIDGQWKSLVQRIRDSGKLGSAIAVCDVSGSMSWPQQTDGTCPMDSAIGLSLLLAEVVEEPWGGAFISFSESPSMHKVGGLGDARDFTDKVKYITSSPWGMNTDFEKVFTQLILPVAVKNKLPKEQMVKTVFVFSDMQFDAAKSRGERSTSSYGRVKMAFNKAGYPVPEMIFWNLAGKSHWNVPVESKEPGVAMVSGYSQATMKMFLDNGKFVDEVEEEVEDEDAVDDDKEEGAVEAGVVVRSSKKRKVDPEATVFKAISHKAYSMLKVVD